LGYEATKITCWGTTAGDGYSKSGHWGFNVNDTSDHDVFVATINDNYWESMPEYTDETEFFENSFDHPLVLWDGESDTSVGSFAAHFNFDFHVMHVGTYTWDSDAINVEKGVLRPEAKRRTADYLGECLGMGTAMVSAHLDEVEPESNPTGQTFTMRENHGFDIGFGFLGVPYNNSGTSEVRGTGAAWSVEGATVVGMLNPYIGDPDRSEEVVVHEVCHLFGSTHLPNSSIPDGYTFIFGGGNGDDTGEGEFRMHFWTEGNLSLHQNLLQFAGAARPLTFNATKYGQWTCHVTFIFSAPDSPVQLIENYGQPDEYHWEDTGWYDYFDFTENRWTMNMTANSNSENHSWFFIGYELDWLSDYWPSGFNLSSTDIGLYFGANISLSANANKYTKVRLMPSKETTASPITTWMYYCGSSDSQFYYEETYSKFHDASVYLLFGFDDPSDIDDNHKISLIIHWMNLYYELAYIS
ncbi:MAG: hypothetical protein RTU92_12835, partial [Candidatus Thorarchaeota archaeon]